MGSFEGNMQIAFKNPRSWGQISGIYDGIIFSMARVSQKVVFKKGVLHSAHASL